MARYIDAEKIFEEIKSLYVFLGGDNVFNKTAKESVLQKIDEQPTADVVEVKYGEWIYHECVSSYDGAKSGYSCSVCSAFVNDEVFESDGFHKDFCGHCGADMRGDDK